MSFKSWRRMAGFVAGGLAFFLGVATSAAGGEQPDEQTRQSGFSVGVTQLPMYTLASALTYGSPVKTLLVEQDESGRWRIPPGITVLFWSGAALEPELAKTLQESQQAAVALMEAAGVHQLAKRTPADWRAPMEDADPHNESLGQGGYGMVQTMRPQGQIDTNYWLDPLNAMAALEAMKMVLQGLDQRNHWAYQGNSDQIVQALWELDVRVSKLLHDVSNQPFVVLQDEFQYLEQRYRLSTVPSGGSAQDIVHKAKARGAHCVVATRPFDDPLKAALHGAGLAGVVLDPAGRQMPNSTGAYFQWFGKMVSALKHCMAQP
jgi:ABC-type Zn2+ transport system substrate-binding protein/surface adhesin